MAFALNNALSKMTKAVSKTAPLVEKAIEFSKKPPGQPLNKPSSTMFTSQQFQARSMAPDSQSNKPTPRPLPKMKKGGATTKMSTAKTSSKKSCW